MGIIRKFTASPSLFSQKAIHIMIFGSSKTGSIISLKPKLEANPLIYWLAVGGGNELFVGAYLREISELDALARFVKETAQMPEPTVGLTTSPIPANALLIQNVPKLCELDYKIIRSLKDDSRKPTNVIAEEIGVSAKTVRHRLTRMIDNFLIELSIEWYPDTSNDIMSLFEVKIKDDATPNAANIILQKHYPNLLFYWGFSNIPNTYLFMAWTPSSKELRELRESFEAEPPIQSVSPNIIYTGYIFSNWRKNF
jgi:DNA-binding Lrp family transcriptional regulator